MRRKHSWGKIMGIIVVTFLIPYFATLMLWDHVDELSLNEFYSGRTVVLKETKEIIDVEEYLVMVVAAQVPASWHEEAIKVQAILARTALYQKMGQSKSIEEEQLGIANYTIREMEEVWGKKHFETYYYRIRNAVEATAKQVVLWQGNPVEVLYHYASCGTTRNDETGYYPYFKTVDSPYDREAPGYLQSITMTTKDLIEKIRLLDGGEQLGSEQIVSSIQITKKDAIGYVEQVSIEGKSFSGIQVANVLGITSCCFTIEAIEEGVRITALGVGNGYGVSQWGAKSMAEEGNLAEDILRYYYSGCEIGIW